MNKSNNFLRGCVLALALACSASAQALKWSYPVALPPLSSFDMGSLVADGRGGCAFTWYCGDRVYYAWLNRSGKVIAQGSLPEGDGGGGLLVKSLSPARLVLHHTQYTQQHYGWPTQSLNAVVAVHRGNDRFVEKKLVLGAEISSAPDRYSDRAGYFEFDLDPSEFVISRFSTK